MHRIFQQLKAKLSLRKADHTAYVRRPASNFQSEEILAIILRRQQFHKQ